MPWKAAMLHLPSSPNPWAAQRRHELDWLRVLAFALLIFYHLGMAYVADWDWHIKSVHQSEALQYPMRWSNQWRMSLLFLISGAALSCQLRCNHGWHQPWRLTRRLLLPLIFGSLVVVAPQSFVESKLAGAIADMGFPEFWRHYAGYPWGFGEPLPPAYRRLEGANAIWNHLWYLPYLFTYCLLAWALYPLVNQPAARQAANRLAQSLPLALLYLLPCLLIFVIGQWLWEDFPTTHTFVNDWHNHARSFAIFMLGFGLVRSQRLWQALARMRHLSLLLAVVCYGMISSCLEGGRVSTWLPWLAGIEAPLQGFIWSANLWLWLMALIGYAQVWLNRPSALLESANRAVYCWYIFHQTLIVAGLYLLRPASLGPLWEPLLLLVGVIAGCGLTYWLVSKVPLLRGLCGIFQHPEPPSGTGQGRPANRKLPPLQEPSGRAIADSPASAK